MLKMCVWNKGFVLGPTSLLNLTESLSNEIRRQIRCDPMYIKRIIKLAMIFLVAKHFQINWKNEKRIDD